MLSKHCMNWSSFFFDLILNNNILSILRKLQTNILEHTNFVIRTHAHFILLILMVFAQSFLVTMGLKNYIDSWHLLKKKYLQNIKFGKSHHRRRMAKVTARIARMDAGLASMPAAIPCSCS